MPPSSPEPDDLDPGLPGLHTWPRVYWFVLGTFVATVVVLALFTRAFSG